MRSSHNDRVAADVLFRFVIKRNVLCPREMNVLSQRTAADVVAGLGIPKGAWVVGESEGGAQTSVQAAPRGGIGRREVCNTTIPYCRRITGV